MNPRAFNLTLIATVCACLLMTMFWLTADAIDDNRESFAQRQLREAWGNDDIGLSLINPRVFAVSRKGELEGFVVRSLTSAGYNGDISLWIGIDLTHTVRGVRVIDHRETPGLGDKIETRVSSWILDFDGRSLSNPSTADWDVQKYGGAFDQFSGATITPRAVVHAVRKTLEDSHQQQDTWIENSHERQL